MSYGCGCEGTTHDWDCFTQRPSGGVAQMIQLDIANACTFGNHAWMPWLRLDNGSFVTWCIHCNRKEQYDQ